jgi:hypothetical protein
MASDGEEEEDGDDGDDFDMDDDGRGGLPSLMPFVVCNYCNYCIGGGCGGNSLHDLSLLLVVRLLNVWLLYVVNSQ